MPIHQTDMAPVEIGKEVQRVETEAEKVFAWRYTELQRVGFPDRLAYKLALRTDVDLRRATTLVQRGCSPEMAAQILV